MIDLRVIVEVIVIVHVVVIDQDNWRVKVVVVPVEASIRVVAAVSGYCRRGAVGGRGRLDCAVVGV